MFSSVVSNVLTKGRIREEQKKKKRIYIVSITKIIAVIVEDKSKGETSWERSFSVNAYIWEETGEREGKLVLEQISESSFI